MSKKRRPKLVTIYKPQNPEIEKVLRTMFELSGLKSKGVSFGRFILISAVRDANTKLLQARELEEKDNERNEERPGQATDEPTSLGGSD